VNPCSIESIHEVFIIRIEGATPFKSIFANRDANRDQDETIPSLLLDAFSNPRQG
jgi:hypothetical protein